MGVGKTPPAEKEKSTTPAYVWKSVIWPLPKAVSQSHM